MFDILILAAGEGKRMGDGPPKILRLLCGKSLLERIVNTVSKLNYFYENDTPQIYIVINENIKSKGISLFNNMSNKLHNVKLLFQTEPLGTANAVQPYLSEIGKSIRTLCPLVNKKDYVLILPGDTPLVSKKVLQIFINYCILMKKEAGILAFKPTDGKQYGRIVKNRIIEYKDCTEEEKQEPLCNTGVYVIKTTILEQYLPQIQNNNSQNEYYLTDIFNYNLDTFVYTIKPEDNYKFHGINTLEDLHQCYQYLKN